MNDDAPQGDNRATQSGEEPTFTGARGGEDPTLVSSPHDALTAVQAPAEPLPAGPGSSAPGRRRRWRAALVTAVLVAGAALGGVAAGHAIWGQDEQRVVREYAQEAPSADRFPYEGAPRYEGEAPYDMPSGESGSTPDSTTSAGPSEADVAAITEKVSAGVVDVNVKGAYGSGQGAGSGMILSSSGLVLTNNHVIEGAGEISVTSVGTGRTYAARVVGYDVAHDIALLQLEGASGLETVAIGDSSTVRAGQQIVVIGNAGGDGGEPTASGGVVSALDQQIVASGSRGPEALSGLIQVDATVISGQSGGPTVNMDGEVVGVITAASSAYSSRGAGTAAGGTGYAVPINTAMAIVEQIQDGNESGSVHIGETAFLGVQVASGGSAERGGFGQGYGSGYRSEPAAGALVAGVLADTPAEAAGLQAGDTITAVDGHAIESASALSLLLGDHEPGDSVEVEWIDSYGEAHAATVTLTTGPPA